MWSGEAEKPEQRRVAADEDSKVWSQPGGISLAALLGHARKTSGVGTGVYRSKRDALRFEGRRCRRPVISAFLYRLPKIADLLHTRGQPLRVISL